MKDFSLEVFQKACDLLNRSSPNHWLLHWKCAQIIFNRVSLSFTPQRCHGVTRMVHSQERLLIARREFIRKLKMKSEKLTVSNVYWEVYHIKNILKESIKTVHAKAIVKEDEKLRVVVEDLKNFYWK